MDDEGRQVLAVHHQLMRDIGARKHLHTDVNDKLAAFASKQKRDQKYARALDTTALDDDQYELVDATHSYVHTVPNGTSPNGDESRRVS